MNSSTLLSSKMDGAIVLSNDLKIIYANVHLTPDRNIESKETGIRHRWRTNCKTSKFASSCNIKRRNIISLYYNQEHYVLRFTLFNYKRDHI